MDIQRLLHERQEKDVFLKSHRYSPLTAAQRMAFEGLDYFAPNADLELIIAVDENEEKLQRVILTNTGDERVYQEWGKVHFMVNDTPVELLLLYNEEHDHYFLPFMDGTSGVETYSGGRYLDPQRLPNGRFVIDFNQAYSPYCAYNEGWSCPIPPKENRLTVRIEAGEKNLPEH